jgi:hypothetical protein
MRAGPGAWKIAGGRRQALTRAAGPATAPQGKTRLPRMRTRRAQPRRAPAASSSRASTQTARGASGDPGGTPRHLTKSQDQLAGPTRARACMQTRTDSRKHTARKATERCAAPLSPKSNNGLSVDEAAEKVRAAATAQRAGGVAGCAPVPSASTAALRHMLARARDADKVDRMLAARQQAARQQLIACWRRILPPPPRSRSPAGCC